MRWIVYAIGLLALTLLQTSAVPAFQLLGVGTNLILIVLCCWVVVRGQDEGFGLVPLAGIWMGLLSFQGLATSVAAFLPVIMLATLRRPLGVQSEFGWALALVVAATVAHFVVIALVLEIGGSAIDWFAVTTDVLLPTVLVNLVVAVPVYLLIRLPTPRAKPAVSV